MLEQLNAVHYGVLIPFVQGGVFRLDGQNWVLQYARLNPFRTGRGLSTTKTVVPRERYAVLIPFVQGGVFRPLCSLLFFSLTQVLIPFVQGGVFRPFIFLHLTRHIHCLNPFRTGRGLSTYGHLLGGYLTSTS